MEYRYLNLTMIHRTVLNMTESPVGLITIMAALSYLTFLFTMTKTAAILHLDLIYPTVWAA